MINYFTFGQHHVHPVTGEKLKDYWIEVHDKTPDEARKMVIEKYGVRWSFQYDETNFDKEFFPKRCYEVLK